MKTYIDAGQLFIQPENENEDFALEQWSKESTNQCDFSVKPMKLIPLSLLNLYEAKRRYKRNKFNDFYFNKLPQMLRLKML